MLFYTFSLKLEGDKVIDLKFLNVLLRVFSSVDIWGDVVVSSCQSICTNSGWIPELGCLAF